MKDFRRGQTGTWHQARLSRNRTQILRSQQGSRDLALYRQGRTRGAADDARAPEPAAAAPAPAAAAPAEEAAAPEPQEAEFVSLEDADAEAQGAKAAVETSEPDIEEEVEMDETLDDAAFIEEQEEEDADVTDIIGGDIENEEEG